MKVKRDRQVTKKFYPKDVELWQSKADEQTGGNLTLWIELVCNAAAKSNKKVLQWA
jgi:hypothetical protein